MSTTLNPSAFSIFADDPKDYASQDSAGESLQDIIEDDYDTGDFAADIAAAEGSEDEQEDAQEDAPDDERADENDYSHGEGEPDAVETQPVGLASDELEEYERGDPTREP